MSIHTIAELLQDAAIIMLAAAVIITLLTLLRLHRRIASIERRDVYVNPWDDANASDRPDYAGAHTSRYVLFDGMRPVDQAKPLQTNTGQDASEE